MKKLGAEPFSSRLFEDVRRASGRTRARAGTRGEAFAMRTASIVRRGVADSKQNRDHFGSSEGRTGESGYPMLRLATLMAVRNPTCWRTLRLAASRTASLC